MTGQEIRLLVAKQVGLEIKKYLRGNHIRRCVTCGISFEASSRRHVFHTKDCHKAWYRGWFFPKKVG